MKITVSQKEKKLEIIFEGGKVVDKYAIDKAEEFLVCVDKLLKKRKIADRRRLLRGLTQKDSVLEFYNTGLLTERVIRAIMLGLCF